MPKLAFRKGLREGYTFALCCVSVLTGLVTLAAWYRNGEDDSVDSIRLSVDDAFLDFGQAVVTDNFDWQLPIVNESNCDLVIGEVQTSCLCATAERGAIAISPGETYDLALSLDLSRSPALKPVRSHAAFETDVAIFVSEPARKVFTWSIRGCVERPIRFEPPFLPLRHDLVHGFPYPPTKFVATIDAGAEVSEVRCKPPLVEIERLSGPNSGNDATFAVVPTPDVRPGSFSFTLYFDVQIDGSAVDNIPLHGTGTILEDVAAYPRAIAFGRRPLGATATANLTLLSRTGSRFEIAKITAKDGTIVQPCPIFNSDGNRRFSIEQHISGNANSSKVRFHIYHEEIGDTTKDVLIYWHAQQDSE